MQPLRLQRGRLGGGVEMRDNGGGAVRPRIRAKAKALGRTEPLLLSVPSGGAAHRSGERRPPDTREDVGAIPPPSVDGTREQS